MHEQQNNSWANNKQEINNDLEDLTKWTFDLANQQNLVNNKSNDPSKLTGASSKNEDLSLEDAAESALNDWKKSVMYSEEWLKMTPEERLKAEQEKYAQIYGRLSANAGASTAAAPAPTAAPQTGSPVSVSNKAEYDKLKPGQTYFDPNGQLRVKG
jgi:hypothetical protein